MMNALPSGDETWGDHPSSDAAPRTRPSVTSTGGLPFRLWGVVLVTLIASSPGAPAQDVDRPSETVRLSGLRTPVRVITDRWGVKHIRAETEEDLFFAQGYTAARDRTFQFELWRRQATGTVAEVLGPRELPRDIGARLLRFRGDWRREWEHYHPRGERIIAAFTAGINAWIDQTREDPSLLSIEFRMLGIRPEPWTPEVVVSRHQGLVHNATQELALGRAVAAIGADRVHDSVWFHPGRPEIGLDPAIDAKTLEADVLRLYRAARSPVRFLPEDVLPEYRAEADGDEADGDEADGDRGSGVSAHRGGDGTRSGPDEPAAAVAGIHRMTGGHQAGVDLGSNNWVISGRLSQSGSPLMANDPHRVLHAPSLRYFTHLSAPGWDVIGGGEPTLPGVSIGHNGFGTWGLTVFRIDAEDLYVYETHPDAPSRYRYGDGWEAMEEERQTIPVKGQDDVEVTLRFTRHGPVLHQDPERRVAWALRAGWLEVGGAPYLASLRMNQARSWEAFRDACAYSHIPGENMVWADREGNIGWQAVGIAPLRPNWDGLVPVPGDGRYEWAGFLPGHELPYVVNPDQGFWNTSNENVVPLGYRHRRAVAWTWSDPFRGSRVHEVLASGRRFGLPDMARLQQDELSIPARALTPLLSDVTFPGSTDAATLAARELLRDWDFVLDRDSAAAAIYVMWQRHLQAKLRELLVPEAARQWIGDLSMKRQIDWLLAPDGRFGEDPLSGRDQVLIDSFASAIGELVDRFGDRPQAWRYGHPDYKHALIRHPLGNAVRDEFAARLNVGPAPRGGDLFTVNNTGSADNQPSGGTFRLIVDTSDWDATLATNAPGQGGDPDGGHYDDLFEMWAAGLYFPLFYSEDKVGSVAEHTRWLVPPGNPLPSSEKTP